MVEPAIYLAQIAAGKIVRYGAILKDANTGQIVGHLKEAGGMGELLSSVAPSALMLSNPVTAVASVAGVLGDVYQGVQLHQIQETLKGLGMMTNIAAFSSVAGLGVSVAGFALVNKKLNTMDSKLDSIASDVSIIMRAVDELKISWQEMSNAQLQKATQDLITAEKAETDARTMDLAKEAASGFSLLRNYYHNLLSAEGLYSDIALNVGNLQEIISRYNFTCIGLLQAELITGDLGSYRSRLDLILADQSSLLKFSPREVYQGRCDKLAELTLDHDYEGLSNSLVGLNQYTEETCARVEGYSTELEYLEQSGMSVNDYLRELRDHETGIVLIPRK